MKTVFEAGELVCRDIFCKTGESENKLIGGVIGHIVGRKADRENIYEDVVIFTQRDGHLYARKYDAIDTTGGLDCLTKSYKKDGKQHPEWILTDEAEPSVSDMQNYLAAQKLETTEGNIKSHDDVSRDRK